MTLKSRKTGATRRSRKATKSAAKSAAKSDVKLVRDTAVLKRGVPSPNTSAFKSPARAPVKLDKLTAAARKKLVTKLIPAPEPPPSADVSQAVKALEPPVRRFHGTKVPLHWFPRPLDRLQVRRQVRLHVLGVGAKRDQAAVQRHDRRHCSRSSAT